VPSIHSMSNQASSCQETLASTICSTLRNADVVTDEVAELVAKQSICSSPSAMSGPAFAMSSRRASLHVLLGFSIGFGVTWLCSRVFSKLKVRYQLDLHGVVRFSICVVSSSSAARADAGDAACSICIVRQGRKHRGSSNMPDRADTAMEQEMKVMEGASHRLTTTPAEGHSTDAMSSRAGESGSVTTERSPSGSYTSEVTQTVTSADRAVSRWVDHVSTGVYRPLADLRGLGAISATTSVHAVG
jgi:hypothetical protein